MSSFTYRPFADLLPDLAPSEPAAVANVAVADVAELVERLVDPQRSSSVVVISSRSDGKATVDPHRVAERLPKDVHVAVLADIPTGWELSRALPDGCPDVFGGATRVYRPVPLEDDGRHPLVMFFPERGNAKEAEAKIVSFAVSTRTVTSRPAPAIVKPHLTVVTAPAATKAAADKPALVIPLPGAHLRPVPNEPVEASEEVAPAPAATSSFTTAEFDALVIGNDLLRDEVSELRAANRALLSRVQELSAFVEEARQPSRPVSEDPQRQLMHEIDLAHLHSGPESDRGTLRTYSLGPDFLTDLDSDIIDRARTLRVVVDVLTRAAFTMPAREVHPLRSSDAGNASAVTREDGATAYRASIRVKTPGAPRLMWWELTDGSVELARAAHHDDLRIR